MGLTIFYIILIMIVVAQLIWTLFFEGNYRGELIVTLEKKGKNGGWNKTVWFAFLLFFAIALIYELSVINGNISSVRGSSLAPVFWIIMCILQIIRGYDSTEIRGKGMSFNNRFYKYSRVNSFVWLEGDVLRVNYKSIFKQDHYYDIEIQDKETALKAGEALGRYINNRA